MNVFSVFDGMSCGQLALERAGIKVKKYYASEIDKYAIAVTQHRYPETIQLGDVTKIDGTKLDIDLLIGGSPCQGFSFAGKQLNFDDPRSALFFEFVRLLKETKPKYFMLENVRMKKEYQDVISGYLGVEPVMINSGLVSAQNRVRLYWTNIPVNQPDDKGLVLKDILETGVVDRDKSHCLDANHAKGASYEQYKNKSRRQLVGCVQVGEADIKGHDAIKRVYSPEGKAPCLTTMGGGHREPKVACGAFRGRYKVNGIRQDGKMKTAGLTKQELEIRNDEKTNTITTVQKDNVLTKDKLYWRKLTPLECERLQTVPDNYTLVPWQKRMMSNSQRYKMLGNGWTVDVIAHILEGIEI